MLGADVEVCHVKAVMECYVEMRCVQASLGSRGTLRYVPLRIGGVRSGSHGRYGEYW